MKTIVGRYSFTTVNYSFLAVNDSEMQNSKCKIQNDCVREADIFIIISGGNTFILHSAFSILHSTGRSRKLQFIFQTVTSPARFWVNSWVIWLCSIPCPMAHISLVMAASVVMSRP